MIISSLFFILILIVAVPPLLPQQQEEEQPAICSMVDILMSFNNPNIALKNYMCHSA